MVAQTDLVLAVQPVLIVRPVAGIQDPLAEAPAYRRQVVRVRRRRKPVRFVWVCGELDTFYEFAYNVCMTLLNASLDTSFWNVAAQIGVVPYLFSFFRVHYSQA
ncbi:MAG: hypothetical protein D6791_16340, partial [Chloroflexi bacterium]